MAPSTTFPLEFQAIFDVALSNYTKQTGVNIATCPIAQTFQTCDSVDAILDLLQDTAKKFQTYRDGNRKLIDCIKPVVQVLHAVAAIFGEAASLVSPTNRHV
jgi:hypothetical protein